MHNVLTDDSRLIDRTVGALVALAGLCLMAIVVLVSFGVVMRYVFGAPLLGVNEFVQLTAVALVMAAMPCCTARGDHVAVDVFEKALGKWGRYLGDIISFLVSGFVLAILTHRAALKALDALQWGDATNMLRMPVWPFYGILSAGAGLCVIIMALQLFQIIARGPR